MKKNLIKVICTLFSVLFVFYGCSSNTEQPTTEPTTAKTEISTVDNIEQPVIVSDEVQAIAEDTIEAVESGVEIDTSEELPASKADEEAIENEQAIEQDAMVEQENISYDGTNTGKGTALLGSCTGLTYYNQADSRWGSIPYTSIGSKSQTIKSSGCGPTSAAMVVSSSKGAILPSTMAKLFVDNGYRTANNGTAWSAWSFVADYFDFDFYKSTSSFSTMEKYLETDKNNDGISDYFVVTSCGSGLFTSGGHYIVLMNDKNNTITVYDPYYYYGKFSTASRKAANVKVSGNIAYVTESAFKKYGNIKNYWIFSNEYTPAAESKPSTTVPNKETKQPTKKYVKTNGAVLNVRSGAGTAYKVVKTLSNNSAVTEYATKNGWSRIDKTKELWASSKYLTSKEPAKATAPTTSVSHVYIPATGRYAYCKTTDIEKINGYHRLKKDTVLYSKSNLTGTKYNYLAKTRVSVLK